MYIPGTAVYYQGRRAWVLTDSTPTIASLRVIDGPFASPYPTYAEDIQTTWDQVQDTGRQAVPKQEHTGLMNDRRIAELCDKNKLWPMIHPFHSTQIKTLHGNPVISYGVSSHGYDIRVGDEFKIFRPRYDGHSIIDPKSFDSFLLEDFKGDVCIIPPNSFVLAMTMEYFDIPRNVQTICVGKSTYARCGVVLNVTPFESEWEGYATLEISNTSPLPAKIYANEGIAQVLFFEQDEEPEVSYKDRKGKYDKQTDITLPRV